MFALQNGYNEELRAQVEEAFHNDPAKDENFVGWQLNTGSGYLTQCYQTRTGHRPGQGTGSGVDPVSQQLTHMTQSTLKNSKNIITYKIFVIKKKKKNRINKIELKCKLYRLKKLLPNYKN